MEEFRAIWFVHLRAQVFLQKSYIKGNMQQ